jgi:hypothetical protein
MTGGSEYMETGIFMTEGSSAGETPRHMAPVSTRTLHYWDILANTAVLVKHTLILKGRLWQYEDILQEQFGGPIVGTEDLRRDKRVDSLLHLRARVWADADIEREDKVEILGRFDNLIEHYEAFVGNASARDPLSVNWPQSMGKSWRTPKSRNKTDRWEQTHERVEARV